MKGFSLKISILCYLFIGIFLFACQRSNIINVMPLDEKDNIGEEITEIDNQIDIQTEIALLDQVKVLNEGQCGENLYWKLYENGVFRIYGEGEMYDYNYWKLNHENDLPWLNSENKNYIKKLILEEGITRIPEYSFWGSEFDSGLIIPDTVVEIGKYAFNQTTFSGDLVIGKNVRSIGDTAFYNATFGGKLILGDNIKEIGEEAFALCDFTGEIRLTSSIEKIGKKAFQNCEKLTGDLIIPDSVIEIGEFAFSECDGLSGTLTLGKNIKTIGESAFNGCKNLKGSLVIPDSVIEIGKNAFSNCSGFDGNIILPAEIKLIDGNPFAGMDNIVSFSIEKKNDEYKIIDGIIYSKDLDTIIACPGGKKGKLIIPDGVKRIGDYAFYRCELITGELVIPDSVIEIGSLSFWGCIGIESLSFGSHLEVISNAAFAYSDKINCDLILPESLVSIRDLAFFNCPYINTVTFLGDRPNLIGEDVFGEDREDSFIIYYHSNRSRWTIPSTGLDQYNLVAITDMGHDKTESVTALENQNDVANVINDEEQGTVSPTVTEEEDLLSPYIIDAIKAYYDLSEDNKISADMIDKIDTIRVEREEFVFEDGVFHKYYVYVNDSFFSSGVNSLITAKRYEDVHDKISKEYDTGAKTFQAFYTLKDIDDITLTMRGVEDILIKFPIAYTKKIYVRDPMLNKRELNQTNNMVKTYAPEYYFGYIEDEEQPCLIGFENLPNLKHIILKGFSNLEKETMLTLFESTFLEKSNYSLKYTLVDGSYILGIDDDFVSRSISIPVKKLCVYDNVGLLDTESINELASKAYRISLDNQIDVLISLIWNYKEYGCNSLSEYIDSFIGTNKLGYRDTKDLVMMVYDVKNTEFQVCSNGKWIDKLSKDYLDKLAYSVYEPLADGLRVYDSFIIFLKKLEEDLKTIQLDKTTSISEVIISAQNEDDNVSNNSLIPVLYLDFSDTTGIQFHNSSINENALHIIGQGKYTNGSSYALYETDVFKNTDWTNGMTISFRVLANQSTSGMAPLYTLDISRIGYISIVASLESAINTDGNENYNIPRFWNDPSNKDIGGNIVLPKNEWAYVTVVYLNDNPGNVIVYLNGNEYNQKSINLGEVYAKGVNSDFFTKQIPLCKSLRFGSWLCEWWNYGDFIGYIDDFAIYNKALTQNEINTIID